jgi:hypothetical protein
LWELCPFELKISRNILLKTYVFAIKFSEWSKSGKKHPLPIDLSTENKKAKRSAYEKERRLKQLVSTTPLKLLNRIS